jgi:hypothetical protein
MTSKAAPYQQDTKEGADLPRKTPPGQVSDASYKTCGTEPVPVVDDDAPVEDAMKLGQADSDRQLGMSLFVFRSWMDLVWVEVKLDLPCVCLARGVREGCHADCHWGTERDEREAMDKGNIMRERTRHAKPLGTYWEPLDEQMGLTR